MVLFLHRLGWFVFLVLLQVLVLNHVHILGYATPMLYIYYILILNAETPRKSLLLQAFFIGLCIDIFSNTRNECGSGYNDGFYPSSVTAYADAS